MHYCCLLITKEIPTKEDIDKIMEPYKECDEMYEKKEKMSGEEISKAYPFTWDYYLIGGRYGGYIKYKFEGDDYKFYNHNLNHKKILSKLFDDLNKNYQDRLAKLLEKNEVDEAEFVEYLGYRDKFIYCDGSYISKCDLPADLRGYVCIDSIRNKVYAREVWNGSEWIKDKDYDNKVAQTIQNSQEGFITVLDFHN